MLKSGKSAFDLGISPDHADFEVLQSMKLLSVKPVLYVANVDETSAENGNEFSRALEDYVKKLGHGEVVTLSAALEFEVKISKKTCAIMLSFDQYRMKFGSLITLFSLPHFKTQHPKKK